MLPVKIFRIHPREALYWQHRLIREPMDNEEEEFFDDNDSDVLDNEIGSKHKYQSINVYSHLLPNSEKIQEQADAMLDSILSNIARCIAADEVRPGMARCDRQLRDYIQEFKFRFTKEQHIQLVKTYFYLITSEELDPFYIKVFCTTFSRLLRFQGLISREELVLDWRPMLRLYKSASHNPKANRMLIIQPYRYCSIVKSACRSAKRYYSADSTQDILDEFMPMFCTASSDAGTDTHNQDALTGLMTFLPVLVYPDEIPKTIDLWLPMLMDIWMKLDQSKSWEKSIIAPLVQQASIANIGRVNLQMWYPEIFNKILRSFELQVGEAWSKWRPALAPISSTIAPGFIISFIGGKRPEAQEAFQYFEKMIEAVATYVHPSNHGKWTEKLLQFLDSLTQKFIARLSNERYRSKPSWIPLPPDDRRLTDQDIDRFVGVIQPLAMTALFNKAGPQYAANILQFLALCQPNKVLPDLVKRCQIAFNSLTEPHQASSCIYALVGQISIILSHNVSDEIRLSLMPILQDLIPSIDINDQGKANWVLYLFDYVFTNSFLEDCSSFIGDDGLSERDDKLIRQSMMVEGLFWQYWDQKLMYISACNSQKETSGEGSQVQLIKPDTDATMHVGFTPAIAACSKTLFPQLLRKIFDYCRENVYGDTTASFMTTNLVQSLVVKDADQTLALFFPWLYKKIKNLHKENPEVITDEYHMDIELQWYLIILSDLIIAAGECILPYIEEITEILNIVKHLRIVTGMKIVCKLHTYLVTTLAGVHIYRRPHELATLKTDEKSVPSVTKWGALYRVKEAKDLLGWHTPTQLELDTVVDIFESRLQPCIDKLNDMGANGVDLVVMKQNIAVIIGCLAGIMNSVNFNHGAKLPPVKGYESVLPDHMPTIKISQHPFLEEKLADFPQQVFGALTKILQKLEEENNISDHRTMHWILTAMNYCFNFRPKMTQNLQHHADHYKRLYGLYRLQQHKKYPFVIIEVRVYNDLLSKSAFQYDYTSFTQNHLDYLKILVKYAQSPFTRIRKIVQSIFTRVFKGKTVMNICGQHLEGRHEMFLDDITATLEKHSAQNYQAVDDKTGDDEPITNGADVVMTEDIEGMSDSDLVKFLTERTKDELTDRKFKPYIDRLRDSPELIKQFQRTVLSDTDKMDTTEVQKTETTDIETHKTLKGALYLLDLYKQGHSFTFLMNGHQSHTCRKMWPLVLKVRCDKKSVNDLVMHIFKSVMDTYSTLHFENKLQPACLESIRHISDATLDDREQADVQTRNELKIQTRKQDHQDLKEALRKLCYDENLSWTRRKLCYSSFAKYMVRLDTEIEPSDVELLACELVNERPKWRFAAFTYVQTVLHKIKRARPREYLRREDATDLPGAEDLKYKSAFRTEDAWNNQRYYGNRTHLGYRTWTTTAKRYAPIDVTNPPTYPKNAADVSDIEMPLWKRITDPVWVATVADQLAHWDKNEKIHESYMRQCNCFFINLFRNFGPESVKPWIPWVEKLIGHRETRYMRVAIVIWAAIITCMNHWPASEAFYYQKWAVSILDTAIADVSEEVKGFWEKTIENFTSSRDIRQYAIIYDYLLDTSRLLQENTSLSNEFRLTLVRKCVSQGISWKAPGMREKIFTWIMDSPGVISNDYHMIRAAVGQLLFSTLIWKTKDVVSPDHPFAEDIIGKVFDKYESMSTTDSKNVFNTMLFTLNKIIAFGLPGTWKWLGVLLKETGQAEFSDDSDRDKMTRCLVALAQSYQKREVVSHGINVMFECAAVESWQMRLTLLKLLQRVLFRNFFLNQIHCEKIEKLVYGMLDDERTEVRECAGRTLSGLFRCKVIQPSHEQRIYFTNKFKNAKTEVQKDSAILGLEALVGSAPYDVPIWLPFTIEPLCLAASNGKSSASKVSAQRALREFKHTHYDQWEEHRHKFNEEQRHMLTDILVSPSYYA